MSIWNQITVLSIDNIYFVPSVKDHNTTISNRRTYGLSFCYGGKITYHWNGAQYVSDHTCAILLPKDQSYFLKREESGSFPVINFVCTSDIPLPPFLRVSLRNPKSYLKLCERMRELWITQKNPAKLMSLLYDIFGQLAEEESELSLPLSSIIEYMGTHFNDPLLSNEILAEQAHISEVYFRKLFKESYGVTPHQYILELRIRHAKLLLSEQSATVTAISEACGFSSVYHFCRSFKQITGMTPREFEKNESING